MNVEMTPGGEKTQISVFHFFLRNRAIADYLRSNGYEEAYSTFKKEAELDMVWRDRCTEMAKSCTCNFNKRGPFAPFYFDPRMKK